MSNFSTIRATSNTDRRSGLRTSAAAQPTEDAKLPLRTGFGVNASDRRSGREPFRPSETGGSESVKDRDQRASQTVNKHRHDAARVSWNPQVSLVSATTAPLASRISVPPLSALAPQELQPASLTELSQGDQENAIIEDLLFVFMGFEGQYIRFVDSYNPMEEKERLTGPEFRILAGLDPSLRDLAQSMLRTASHYIALEAFIEVQTREEHGSVNHALCASIRKTLKDYLILIAQLEHQQLTNDNFTLHLVSIHTRSISHTLLQLYNLAHEILKRNSILEDDLDDSDNMEDVDDIIESLREGADAGGLAGRKVCKGGSVLGLITKRLSTMSGDPAARELLTTLLRETSKPYMVMLNEWLHHGGIRDPHGEFLIKEQRSIKREKLEQDYTDEYWEKRYTIREGDVPPQLEGVKDKVLLAGKYLNVVRECGGVDVSKEVKDVPVSFEDPRFLDNVNGAYAHANSSLLTLLLTTHALPARLRSLKHYFFLDRSDFFSYFLELGTSELKKKPAKIVNTGKLQSLLDIVLRQPGTVAAEDPYKEDIKVCMNEVRLTDWLIRIVNVTGLDADASNANMSNLLTPAAPTAGNEDKPMDGFEALVLDYAVPFPLSLVISRVTLTRYQLLFRYLLSLQHLETLLVNSWTDQNKLTSWRRRSSDPKIELFKKKAWTLRARMLCFVQQLLYFSTAEVIEPNWQGLMARLTEQDENGKPAQEKHPSQVKGTVDELMQHHVDFLATCLKECMLTNSKLLKINSKLMNACTSFANFTSSFSQYLVAADSSLSQASSKGTASGAAGPAIAYDPSKLEKAIDYLQKFETNFGHHLKLLLDALNYLAATETQVFLQLCARLSMASEGIPGMSIMNYGGP